MRSNVVEKILIQIKMKDIKSLVSYYKPSNTAHVLLFRLGKYRLVVELNIRYKYFTIDYCKTGLYKCKRIVGLFLKPK